MDFSGFDKPAFGSNNRQVPMGGLNMQPQGNGRPRGRGGLLTSLISEGGAAGGAALGTALLPGIGTILGAGLGAFGGRLAENQVRDQRWGVGDAAKEGGMSAAFASVAPLMKAGKAGMAAKNAGGTLDDVLLGAKNAFGSAPESMLASKLGNTSDNLKKSVINPTVKAGVFGSSEEDAIAKVVDKYVKGGTAARKYGNLESAFNGISDDIQKQLSTVTKKTSTVDFTKKLTSSLADDVNFIPGDSAYEKELSRVLNKVASFGKNNELSASDLFKAKQYLNSQLKGAFNKSGADLTVPQQVRMAVWDRLDNTISEIAPGVKDLTRAQSMLIKSAPGLKKSAEKSIGVPMLGVKSNILEQGLQKGRYAGANVLNQAGNMANMGARASSAIVPQVAGRALFGNGSYDENNPITQNNADTTIDTTNMPANMSNMMSSSYQSGDPLSSALFDQQDGFGQPTSNGGSPYSKQNLLADLQRDPKNSEKYIAYYQALDEVFNPKQEKEKPLNATQQQQANNSISALKDLQYIRDALIKDPSTAMKNSLPGGGLTRRFTGTANYEAARQNVADVLGRLRSGGAINKDEERRFLAQLPGAFEDPVNVNAKLRRLEDLFTRFANPTPAGDSLDSVLMGGYGGQQQGSAL